MFINFLPVKLWRQESHEAPNYDFLSLKKAIHPECREAFHSSDNTVVSSRGQIPTKSQTLCSSVIHGRHVAVQEIKVVDLIQS
ncbi:hypothetical protein CDAR_181501 [Caerostris darwini]|uniref:Uncharacterized protein n=1 Tax=Caerostris darwini TaxID=1538125 RepID=A0AAV4U454_9ARAC|nr:hypothetical protein CDAR_181501 [Caerostris darwini]